MPVRLTFCLLLLVGVCLPFSFATAASEDNGASEMNGEFSLLTYNVAGLSDWISKSTPSVNTPIIGKLINAYDLVLVQEDFEYHDALDSAAKHAHRSAPMTEFSRLNSDGLNRFSMMPFTNHERLQWIECHGVIRFANDCLAVKGFSFARHQLLSDGLSIDVYNLHADAGRAEGDKAARRASFSQLAEFIAEHSQNTATIVAGDTNLRGTDADDEAILQEFLRATGLTVAARSLGLAPEGIDRVMIRSGHSVQLDVLSRDEASEFVDAAGAPLSDHPAITARIRWERLL